MREDELQRWAYVIDDIVKGNDVELLFPTVRQARHAFGDCIKILNALNLPYDAHRYILDMKVRVCGTVRFLIESDERIHRPGWRPGW